MKRKPHVIILDSVIAVAALLWSSTWVVRWAHAPDLRRGVLALLALSLTLPAFREGSRIVQGLRSTYVALGQAKVQTRVLLGLIAVSTAMGCARALALKVPLYDVGLFHQIFWSLSQGNGFHSTISGAGNFLQDHFSPALILLAPFYWITGWSQKLIPFNLFFLHSLLLWGGVWAWVRWARREMGPAVSRLILLVSVLSAALWGNLSWGFHENALGFFALSWFLNGVLTIDRDSGTVKVPSSPLRIAGLTALFLTFALSKEIQLLNAALLLIGIAWYRKQSGWTGRGGAILVASLLVAVFVAFELSPHPADKNYFHRYYAYLGDGLLPMARVLIAQPLTAITRIQESVGFGEIFGFLAGVLLPWMGLPLYLFWRDSRAIWLGIALLPSLASILLAAYPPLRFLHYHYVLELIPILAYLSLLALKKGMESGSRLRATWIAALWLGFQAWNLPFDPPEEIISGLRDSRATASVRRVIREIPAADSVLAHELAGTWVSARADVARFPEDYKLERCPQWLILRKEEVIAEELPRGLIAQVPRLRGCLADRTIAPASIHGDWLVYRL